MSLKNITTPEWVQAALEVVPQEGNDAVLSTLRQEKSRDDDPYAHIVGENWYDHAQRVAWWTCSDCPQPNRWAEWKPDNNLTTLIRLGSENTFRWITVERCKRCNRQRNRHYRAKKSLAETLAAQIQHVGTSARFVTLSVPNVVVPLDDSGLVDPEDLAKLIRDLKAKMYAFSRTKAYQKHVIGAVEFYEQTYKIADGGVEVNTHIHAVWLGQYWDQADLQESWGSIPHITRPKNKYTVMKYISKYVTKDAVPGTRSKETRGVLRKMRPAGDG